MLPIMSSGPKQAAANKFLEFLPVFGQTVWKIFKIFLKFYIIFFLLAVILPPLFHAPMPKGWRAADQAYMNLTKSKLERVLSIDHLEDAEFWRYRLIEEANDRIDIAIFEYFDDEAGNSVSSVLLQAADRGVKIRFLVDGASVFGHKSFFQELAAHPNIELKVYNPYSFICPWRNNYRMHEKFLIVDDHLYLLGGRNTNSLFLGNFNDVNRKNRDRDLLVYSPKQAEGVRSLDSLRQHFNQLWNLDLVKPLKAEEGKEEDYQKAFDRYQAIYDNLRKTKSLAFDPVDFKEVTFPVEEIEFLQGSSKPGNKPPLLWSKLFDRMGEGEDVIIETPYIIPDKAMYRDMDQLAADCRQVKILTNSPEGGANLFGSSELVTKRDDIAAGGIHLYEYLGEKSQHAKTILIDDDISIVGTLNFDMRSAYIDTENMVMVKSKKLNAQLRDQFADKMSRSRHIAPDGEVSFGEKIDPVPFSGKENLLKVFRVLTMPIHHLF